MLELIFQLSTERKEELVSDAAMIISGGRVFLGKAISLAPSVSDKGPQCSAPLLPPCRVALHWASPSRLLDGPSPRVRSPAPLAPLGPHIHGYVRPSAICLPSRRRRRCGLLLQPGGLVPCPGNNSLCSGGAAKEAYL